jgi:flagellar hook assembly protein FlgD
LFQNYPNPFNPETTIRFELAARGKVNLTIYDLLGREVVTLLDGELDSGSHQLKWNGKDAAARDFPTGVYFMQLTVRNQTPVKKLSLESFSLAPIVGER